MTTSQLILFGSDLPIFLAMIYAVLQRKNYGKALRAFSWFLYISGVVHFISLILWLQQLNNLPLLHFYVPLGTLCLLYFYYYVLKEYLQFRILHWIAIIFTLFSIFNSIFLQDINSFNSNALTTQSVLITILSLSTFILLLNEAVKQEKKKFLVSLNWINSGLFIYYSSNLIIFYFGKLIMHSISREWSRYTWILHALFSTVMYICFLIGLWKNRKH